MSNQLVFNPIVITRITIEGVNCRTKESQLKADLIMEAKLTIVHMRIKNILCIMMLLFMYIKAKLDFLDMKKEKR